MVVFKERLILSVLMLVLDCIRDVVVVMPVSARQLEEKTKEENGAGGGIWERIKWEMQEFKDYLDKIHVERKFTARFMSISGQ
jgi:hypothetical protein